jgi:DNA-3-methyladenine glycosylase I
MQPESRKELHKNYHDNYYGFPIHDDNELFGRLILEINQAGLSWETVLKKKKASEKLMIILISKNSSLYRRRS